MSIPPGVAAGPAGAAGAFTGSLPLALLAAMRRPAGLSGFTVVAPAPLASVVPPVALAVDAMELACEQRPAVLALGRAHDVDLPITEHVTAVVQDGLAPHDMVVRLMAREAKPEWTGG